MAHFCNQASFQSERLRRHQVIWGKKSTLDQKNPLIFQHLVIQSTAFERSRKTLYVCCNIACFLIHCSFLKTKLIFRKEIVIRETLIQTIIYNTSKYFEKNLQWPSRVIPNKYFSNLQMFYCEIFNILFSNLQIYKYNFKQKNYISIRDSFPKSAVVFWNRQNTISN